MKKENSTFQIFLIGFNKKKESDVLGVGGVFRRAHNSRKNEFSRQQDNRRGLYHGKDNDNEYGINYDDDRPLYGYSKHTQNMERAHRLEVKDIDFSLLLFLSLFFSLFLPLSRPLPISPTYSLPHTHTLSLPPFHAPSQFFFSPPIFFSHPIDVAFFLLPLFCRLLLTNIFTTSMISVVFAP